jgi:hypothetical protein
MTLRKWAAGIAAFILLATAAPALATTYYVNGSYEGTSGSFHEILDARDARAGTSSALAWGRISKANSTVKSGDVVIIERAVGANYAENINPACQDTASGWVTYVGDIANPEYASFLIAGGATLSKPYVSIKGVMFNSTTYFAMAAARDSIQYCEFRGGSFEFSGSTYSYVGNSHMNCGVFASSVELPTRSVGNTFDSNHFTSLGTKEGSGSSMCIGRADSCRFLFNTFDTPTAGAVSENSAFKLAYSSGVSFRGNRFNIGEGAYPGRSIRALRDSVLGASFDCDTVICTGANRGVFWLGYQGNVGDDGNTFPVRGTTIDSCYFNFVNSYMTVGSEGFDGLTMTHNVIINQGGPVMIVGGPKSDVLIDHNTMVGRVGVIGSALFTSIQDAGWEDTLTVTNNIFHALNTVPGDDGQAAVYYDATEYDSIYAAGGDEHANLLVSDHNLYSYYGSSARGIHYDCDLGYVSEDDSIGKRSIKVYTGWDGGVGCGDRYSWPGKSLEFSSAATLADTVAVTAGVFADTVTFVVKASLPLADSTYKVAVTRTVKTAPSSGKLAVATTTTAGTGRYGEWARWCPSCDDSSKYGSPAFVNSPASEFNPALAHGSLAIGIGSDSSDAGALAYTSPPVLLFSPDNAGFINSLRGGSDSVYLVIHNIGDSDSLRVTGLAVEGLDAAVGSVTLSATSATIGPDRYASVKVKFTPGSGREFINGRWIYRTSSGDTEITGSTNDPARPILTFPISVTAQEE